MAILSSTKYSTIPQDDGTPHLNDALLHDGELPPPPSPATHTSDDPTGLLAPSRPLGSWAREVVLENTGLLLVAASQLFFALMNVAVQKLNRLNPSVTTLELIFVRMAITWLCSVAYMVVTKVPHPFLGPPGVRLLLVLRGLAGFVRLFGSFYSLLYLSLSDATVLTFLSPIGTAIAGACILGEPFSLSEAAAGIFSLAGVVLIARPDFIFGPDNSGSKPNLSTLTLSVVNPRSNDFTDTSVQRLIAVGVAMIGVFGATGVYICIRAIGKLAHPLHNLASFSIQCVIASTIGLLATRAEVVVPTQWEWLALLLAIGVFGFAAQILLTMGLQRETAGRGTIAIYIQIVWAMTFEWLFFRTAPVPLSLVGTVIILVAAVYVAVTKVRSDPKLRTPSTPTEDHEMEESLLQNQRESVERLT